MSRTHGVPRFLLMVLALLLGGTVLGVAPLPAGAATSWRATDLPALAPGPPGSFEASPAVSCASAVFCVAVGSYVPIGTPSLSLGGGAVAMADTLQGTAWTSARLPVPAGGSAVSLSAVSCSTVASCVAVGQYSPPGGGAQPLAETFADGRWTATALPLPARAYFTTLSPVPLLGGVSCSAATSCVAVGVYPVHTGRTLVCCYRYFPLIETLAAARWTAATGPTPPGGSDGSLSDVSCPSTASCVAVGNFTTATGTSPLVDTVSTKRWSAAPLALPPGDSYPVPFPWTVSCAGAECVALGADQPSGSTGGLVAETRSHGHWVPATLALPDGGSYGFPFTYEPQGGVSCASAGSCVAVSTYQQGGAPAGVAETLRGGAWTASTLPAPAGGSAPFPQSVSCAATQACVGVGAYSPGGGGEAALSETLTGTTWTGASLPLPAATPAASLTALSCTSTTSCVGVGNEYDADRVQDPFALTLSGTTWRAVSLSLPAHTPPSANATPLLQGLSCSTATSCVAVGYDPGPALSEHPLVEVMSGTTWKPERLPLPDGFRDKSASLSGISCLSATSCVAVGALESEDDALVETLTGSTWSATVLPPPGTEPRVWLSSVSCRSATWCVAVGAYWGLNPGFSRPVAATLAGTAWHVAALTLPPDARRDVAFTVPMLQSVSCASTASCTAVGFYPTSFDDAAPVAETLSGDRWRPSALPRTAGAHWTLLWGLSCRSATSCVAVGEVDGVPLVEALSGTTWTPAAVPLPPGDSGASLQAVSCTSVATCRAAGGGMATTGVYPVVADHGD